MDFSKLKIAIVHDWLTNMGGSENVVLALMEEFPNADLYTTVVDYNNISEEFSKYNIISSFLQKIPILRKKHQALLPLMPLAIESFNLSGYDIVISSSSACSKGVITSTSTLNICYCHNSMRYAWDAYDEFLSQKGKVRRLFTILTLHYIRQWDKHASARPDYFIVNSNYVAKTVKKYYQRESTIISPPVSVENIPLSNDQGNYYVTVARLVTYKKIDLIIQAFNELGLPLVIIGDGPERERLQKISNSNIQFVGECTKKEVYSYLSKAQAYVQAAYEYFGIAPVEALAAGKPVIAYAAGGALDSVIDGVNGVLFDHQTVESLIGGVRKYQTLSFEAKQVRNSSLKFSKSSFQTHIKRFIEEKMQNFQRDRS